EKVAAGQDDASSTASSRTSRATVEAGGRCAYRSSASAMSGRQPPALADDAPDAAQGTTLALVKASRLACGRVRPPAWSGPPPQAPVVTGRTSAAELVGNRERLVERGERLVQLLAGDVQRRHDHRDVPVRHAVDAPLEHPL